MKTLKLEVPDRVAESMAELVRTGWFLDEAEIVRQALAEFTRRQRLQLQEEFHREDIRWALGLKSPRP